MNTNVTQIANYISQISTQLALRGYITDVAHLGFEDRFRRWDLILFVLPQDQSLQGERIEFVLELIPTNTLGTRADITIKAVEFCGVVDRERRDQLNNAAEYVLYEEVIYNGDDDDYYVDDFSGEVFSNGIPVERVVNGLIKAVEVPILTEDAH